MNYTYSEERQLRHIYSMMEFCYEVINIIETILENDEREYIENNCININ